MVNFAIMKQEQVFEIDSIDTYNKLLGVETMHPLVTVVNVDESPAWMNGMVAHYGVYALFLKQGNGCSARYGREKYDYQEGTIVTFAPGQSVTVEWNKDLPMPRSRALLFHGDLIYGTPLGRKIKDYAFFDYSQREALHLSERERVIITTLLDQIEAELSHPVDHHSQTLITDSISLLLDYCMRYYDRQFITRHKVCSDIFMAFEQQVREYFKDGHAERKGIPTVAYFAGKANLSTSYFGDLIKKEAGMTAQSYIQEALIGESKQLLIEQHGLSINEIAYQLGFQYPQHFTRLFKNKVGMTPNQYRRHATA